MDQQNKKEYLRRFVGVVLTASGLVSYAVSSSFSNLFGRWNWLKISVYILLNFIICFAIMFPKTWQHWRIFQYRDHFTFLVFTITTVYSFYLDKKLKTKPDVYDILSSAAFATASLCLSNQIECGFLDLYYFCGILTLQLMKIKPLFGIGGIGFTCFLMIIRSNLSNPPRSEARSLSLSLSRSRSPDEMAIDIAALLESESISSSRSRSSRSRHSSSTQNKEAMLTPKFSVPVPVPAALPSSVSLFSLFQFLFRQHSLRYRLLEERAITYDEDYYLKESRE